MNKIILGVNAGSSSIKFSVYSALELELIYYGIYKIGTSNSQFTVFDSNSIQVISHKIETNQYSDLIIHMFNWLNNLSENYILTAVGHRIVHGGEYFLQPTIITPGVIEQIKTLIPLAPLHQNYNLNIIQITMELYPEVTQAACFDTCFHQTQNHLAKLFALPRRLTADKIIRYGFHGLSYEYIASVITDKIGALGSERVIVAHLGNGASMCAIHKKQSVATTMGFTTLEGLMMGSRCGRLDPGVILYLLQEEHYSVEQLQHLLYYESGLLGVSGISNDIQELFLSTNPQAAEAIELFCYQAALEFGSLCAALGGCDVLIFTAGIGENIPYIRQKICTYLNWLGAELDEQLNTDNATIISTKASKILVSVIPTNEEYMLAKHTQTLIKFVEK